VTPPVCNNATTTSQQCTCKYVYSPSAKTFVNLCDCQRKVGNMVQVRSGVEVPSDNCRCLNTTVGTNNYLNCSCCVPNPPPTLCEQLSSTNSSVLNCRCNDIVVGGKATFSCDCAAKVNTTTTLTRKGLQLSENSCCCVEKTDPVTRKGFKACNCTQPAVLVDQSCDCKTTVDAKGKVTVACDCADCNQVKSK